MALCSISTCVNNFTSYFRLANRKGVSWTWITCGIKVFPRVIPDYWLFPFNQSCMISKASIYWLIFTTSYLWIFGVCNTFTDEYSKNMFCFVLFLFCFCLFFYYVQQVVERLTLKRLFNVYWSDFVLIEECGKNVRTLNSFRGDSHAHIRINQFDY